MIETGPILSGRFGPHKRLGRVTMGHAPTPSIPPALVQGAPAWTVLRLATPTVIAMLTQSIVNEIDIVFFSWLPCPESSTAQAALLPSLILLWLFGGSLSAISVGTQAITARRFAAGLNRDAGAVLVNSWVVALATSLVFTMIAYATLPWTVPLIIKVPSVQQAAFGYLHWRLLGITSMVATFSFKSFFDGIGKTHVHMVSALIMNALNIVLCLVLIFGRLGMPRLGMTGAGLAGFISTWVGLLILLGWALVPKVLKRFEPFNMRRWSPKISWDILRLSIPGGVATVVVMTGFLLFAMIVSRLDTLTRATVVATDACGLGSAEPVNGAATTVIVGVLKLTFTACLAFGTSTATLVSQSLGSGQPDRAERFGWVSVRLGLVIFGCVGALEGLVFPQQILAFVSHSDAVRHAALVPMRLMGVCTPIIAVGMILTQALFGAGNTRFVMVAETILHFTCLVPLAWLLGITLGFGLVGIWSAAVMYVALLASVMAWKFSRGDWKTIKI
jgi:multidrug resistance protein, MATE family